MPIYLLRLVPLVCQAREIANLYWATLFGSRREMMITMDDDELSYSMLICMAGLDSPLPVMADFQVGAICLPFN